MSHLPARRKATVTEIYPARSLQAAASLYGSKREDLKASRNTFAEAWQEEAWDAYDEVGELRFVSNAVANAVSKARLYVGRMEEGDREPTEVTSNEVATEILAQFGGSRSAQSELLKSLTLQLFVPGDGWVMAAPPGLLLGETWDEDRDWLLRELEWVVLSVSEVQHRAGKVVISRGDGQVECDPENVVLIRVWQPHPRRFWHADSPVRASLPVLRELIGLTKHVSATIDSRLAGAGMLVLPESASLVGDTAQDPDGDASDSSDFLETLMDAMITPIKDRDAAGAVVPVLVKVSDEASSQIGQGNLIRFDTHFDSQAKTLRDEAIRRLGLGLDIAPELLTGVGSSVKYMNAWLVEESNTRLHIEPRLSLICSALTDQFLRPALEDAGVEDAEEMVVWWDLSDLSVDLDRSQDAERLHKAGLLSDSANRRESGFDESDAPTAYDLAMRIVLENPGALQSPGFPELLRMMGEVVDERENYVDQS